MRLQTFIQKKTIEKRNSFQFQEIYNVDSCTGNIYLSFQQENSAARQHIFFNKKKMRTY